MYFNGLSQVESNGKKGIINEFGKEILPLNYDHFYITDDYIEAIVEGKSASKPPKITFFDIEGKPRSKSLSYSGAVYNVNSGLIVVSDFDDKEGLLNQQGKLVMPLQYRRIYIDEEANIIRFEVDNDDVKMGLADMQGKIIVKPKYNRIDEFIDGVANITISEENRSLHGLINIKGEEILKPQFTSMLFDMDDKEKYAQVYNNRMVGVVSRDGRVTVPPKFDEIVYQNKQGDDWGDLAITKLDKKYGIVNINTGKIIAEPIYDYAFSIGKGDSILFCLRSTEEGNYIIDKNGDLVIPITKDVIYPLQYMENNNYFIRKQKDGKKGIISRNNENLIPCIYDNITQLNFDLFKVELDGKIGIVDNKNNPIFPIEFDYLYPRTTLLFAKKGNEYGYIFLDKKVFEPSPIAKQLYEYITRK